MNGSRLPRPKSNRTLRAPIKQPDGALGDSALRPAAREPGRPVQVAPRALSRPASRLHARNPPSHRTNTLLPSRSMVNLQRPHSSAKAQVGGPESPAPKTPARKPQPTYDTPLLPRLVSRPWPELKQELLRDVELSFEDDFDARMDEPVEQKSETLKQEVKRARERWLEEVQRYGQQAIEEEVALRRLIALALAAQ